MAIKALETSQTPGRVQVFVDWIPNQVCVVCDVPPLKPEQGDEAVALDLYPKVLADLNRRIITHGLEPVHNHLTALATAQPAATGQPNAKPASEEQSEEISKTKAAAPASALSRETLALYEREPRSVPRQLLRQFANGQTPVLQSLRYRDGQVLGTSPVPWAFLRRTAQEASTALMFYEIAQPAGALTGEPDQDLQASVDRVRELTFLVNWNLIGTTGPLVSEGWTIRALHPNWVMTGNQNEGGCYGCRPGQSQPGTWGFTFVDQPVLNFPASDTSDANVLVAVLDTSPRGPDIIDAARQEALAAQVDGITPNGLLAQIGAEIQGGATFIVERDNGNSPLTQEYDESGVDGLLPDWGDKQPLPNASLIPYLVTDHGLFVSGIIRSIAPNAEIRLIRALNDFGLGDLRLVARLVQMLPDVLAQSNKSRLVVNLSLGSDIMPGAVLLETWFPNVYKSVQPPNDVPRGAAARAAAVRAARDLDLDFYGSLPAETQRGGPLAALGPEFAEFFTRSHLGLMEVMTWLTEGLPGRPFVQANGQPVEAHALAVAAAGNDWDPDEPRLQATHARPEPRFPAHYDDVLGVAAVTARGEPAQYSNRGDEPGGTNGVATFGGDATRPFPGALGIIERPFDIGIVGIFSSPVVPLLGPQAGPNRHRWVQWAGTSFATPIISAIAAKLWGNEPDLRYLELMAKIVGLATGGVGNELGVPRVRAIQTP